MQVKNYVSGCDRCQWMKSFPEKPAGKLKPNEAISQPWKDITTDFITGLPEAQGYDALFVTCCHYTKQAHIILMSTTTLARGLATLFRDHVWKLHGFPETALSDRGPQFTAEFMKELNEILGIKTKLSTAYHPQTDGQTERVNQEIEQYLRMLVSHRQNDWPEWIAYAEFAYNNKIHTATHISPFFANYGMNPRIGIEPWRAGKSELAKEFAERMKLIHEEAQAALSKAHDDMTCYADFYRGQAPEYKVGDKVWLSTKNLNVDQLSCKLTEHQLGPYEIVKIISSNAVKLKLPASFKIHNVINVSHTRPYHPPVAGQSIIPPEPVTVEGTPEYEVEEIMDSWLKCDKLEFLVKWSGYTDDYNTWGPEANCANSHDIIEECYKSNPSTSRKLRAQDFAGLVFRPYDNLTEPKNNAVSRLEVET